MNADHAKLSATNILAAAAVNPNGFITVAFDKPQGSKTQQNKYHDVNFVMANGEKPRAGISWTATPLKGGIKEKKDRKYGVTLQFRGSSGDLGSALCAIDAQIKKIVETGVENKTVKLKKEHARYRSWVTEESANGEAFDEPLIRMKLAFSEKGVPLFTVLRIEKDASGLPRAVAVQCTEDDVHRVIRSRMITSGFATLKDMVYSPQGISVPLKVQILVIKSPESDAPKIETFMTHEQMLAMCEPDATGAKVGREDNGSDDNDDDEEEEGGGDDDKRLTAKTTPDAQLQALRDLALED